mmetsp:Transcript_24837/g.22551  ORF Transcript_24837/g.22551 Transcript_24837/m.22551 type:complete len:188 (+) Transcript_24837:37-600(+)
MYIYTILYLILMKIVFSYHINKYKFNKIQISQRYTTNTMITSNIQNKNKLYILRFDGGSRGNPGIAGAGAVVYKYENNIEKEIWCGAKYIGNNYTNNVAEYRALILGLNKCVDLNIGSLQIEGDSKLVINQLNGDWKVLNPSMKLLYDEAIKLLVKIPDYQLSHIPRAINRRADELANVAMDLQKCI